MNTVTFETGIREVEPSGIDKRFEPNGTRTVTFQLDEPVSDEVNALLRRAALLATRRAE